MLSIGHSYVINLRLTVYDHFVLDKISLKKKLDIFLKAVVKKNSLSPWCCFLSSKILSCSSIIPAHFLIFIPYPEFFRLGDVRCLSFFSRLLNAEIVLTGSGPKMLLFFCTLLMIVVLKNFQTVLGVSVGSSSSSSRWTSTWERLKLRVSGEFKKDTEKKKKKRS